MTYEFEIAVVRFHSQIAEDRLSGLCKFWPAALRPILGVPPTWLLSLRQRLTPKRQSLWIFDFLHPFSWAQTTGPRITKPKGETVILREYDIDRGPAFHLPSPGKCIYCGNIDVVLTDEHVIPYAIGKNAIILDRACCEVCQKIIQPYEQAVLKKQLGVFRAMVEAPTRNKKDRPKSVILPVIEVDEHRRQIRDLGSREIPINNAPLILNLWQSPPPRILGEPIDPKNAIGSAWRYVESKVADPILEAIAKETGSTHVAFKFEPVNRLHYLRSIAKTAHAYVSAEYGVDAFEPFLPDLILKKSNDVNQYVGDVSGVASLEGATDHSFKITIGEIPEEAGVGKGLIAVFMQLWGDLGSPPHLVIVGKMLTNMQAHFENLK